MKPCQESMPLEDEEEVTKDQELHRNMDKKLSLMKDMAGKPNLCTFDPRYEEMLSFMKEKARSDMKQEMN